MPTYEQCLTKLQRRALSKLSTGRTRILRWYRPEATGAERWLRNALDDPGHALYCLPRRLACRLLLLHNSTCIGTPRHPERW